MAANPIPIQVRMRMVFELVRHSGHFSHRFRDRHRVPLMVEYASLKIVQRDSLIGSHAQRVPVRILWTMKATISCWTVSIIEAIGAVIRSPGQ